MFNRRTKISRRNLTRGLFLSAFIVAGIIATSYEVKAPESTVISEPANLPRTVYEPSENEQTPIREAPASTPTQEQVVTPLPEASEADVSFSPQMPVQGDIIRPFSDNELIYSKTTGDYRTHHGIDIASEILGRVHACDDGTVEEIRNDALMGITITISHTENFVSVYSNLSTDKMVKKGDPVTKGQIISGVGDTALIETGEEGHLHFEIHKEGVPVNPEDYF